MNTSIHPDVHKVIKHDETLTSQWNKIAYMKHCGNKTKASHWLKHRLIIGAGFVRFQVCCFISKRDLDIGVARILSAGVHFVPKKLTNDLFLVVALKDRLNIPPNLTRPSKTVLKIDSCSSWGCTSCPGGALRHFPCKLGLKNFSPPWGCRCTKCTPWLRLWIWRVNGDVKSSGIAGRRWRWQHRTEMDIDK